MHANIRKVNDLGKLIGESHPRAVLTDAEVERLLALRAEGRSVSWLARKFEISRGHAWRICRGRQRCQVPDRLLGPAQRR